MTDDRVLTMLTVREVAERLKVSPGLIYALVESKKIGHHRVGRGRGRIRFSEENLADYLRGTESRPADPAPRRQPVKLKHLRG
jgi:excisionase family DNA binding protein